MNELKRVKAEEAHAKTIRGKALVVFYGERGYVLTWDGGYALRELMSDSSVCSTPGEPFPVTDDLELHSTVVLKDGVYIGELKIVDDGPGDWPGSRETIVRLYGLELATAAEWRAHCRNEWPWEPYPS